MDFASRDAVNQAIDESQEKLLEKGAVRSSEKMREIIQTKVDLLQLKEGIEATQHEMYLREVAKDLIVMEGLDGSDLGRASELLAQKLAYLEVLADPQTLFQNEALRPLEIRQCLKSHEEILPFGIRVQNLQSQLTNHPRWKDLKNLVDIDHWGEFETDFSRVGYRGLLSANVDVLDITEIDTYQDYIEKLENIYNYLDSYKAPEKDRIPLPKLYRRALIRRDQVLLHIETAKSILRDALESGDAEALKASFSVVEDHFLEAEKKLLQIQDLFTFEFIDKTGNFDSISVDILNITNHALTQGKSRETEETAFTNVDIQNLSVFENLVSQDLASLRQLMKLASLQAVENTEVVKKSKEQVKNATEILQQFLAPDASLFLSEEDIALISSALGAEFLAQLRIEDGEDIDAFLQLEEKMREALEQIAQRAKQKTQLIAQLQEDIGTLETNFGVARKLTNKPMIHGEGEISDWLLPPALHRMQRGGVEEDTGTEEKAVDFLPNSNEIRSHQIDTFQIDPPVPFGLYATESTQEFNSANGRAIRKEKNYHPVRYEFTLQPESTRNYQGVLTGKLTKLYIPEGYGVDRSTLRFMHKFDFNLIEDNDGILYLYVPDYEALKMAHDEELGFQFSLGPVRGVYEDNSYQVRQGPTLQPIYGGAYSERTRTMLERLRTKYNPNHDGAKIANAVFVFMQEHYRYTANSEYLGRYDSNAHMVGEVEHKTVSHQGLEVHAAKCDYAAFMAVSYLRELGVPAKMMIGESHLSGNDYLRHAWVRYFDFADEEWKTLDPTPGKFLDFPSYVGGAQADHARYLELQRKKNQLAQEENHLEEIKESKEIFGIKTTTFKSPTSLSFRMDGQLQQTHEGFETSFLDLMQEIDSTDNPDQRRALEQQAQQIVDEVIDSLDSAFAQIEGDTEDRKLALLRNFIEHRFADFELVLRYYPNPTGVDVQTVQSQYQQLKKQTESIRELDRVLLKLADGTQIYQQGTILWQRKAGEFASTKIIDLSEVEGSDEVAQYDVESATTSPDGTQWIIEIARTPTEQKVLTSTCSEPFESDVGRCFGISDRGEISGLIHGVEDTFIIGAEELGKVYQHFPSFGGYLVHDDKTEQYTLVDANGETMRDVDGEVYPVFEGEIGSARVDKQYSKLNWHIFNKNGCYVNGKKLDIPSATKIRRYSPGLRGPDFDVEKDIIYHQDGDVVTLYGVDIPTATAQKILSARIDSERKETMTDASTHFLYEGQYTGFVSSRLIYLNNQPIQFSDPSAEIEGVMFYQKTKEMGCVALARSGDRYLVLIDGVEHLLPHRAPEFSYGLYNTNLKVVMRSTADVKVLEVTHPNGSVSCISLEEDTWLQEFPNWNKKSVEVFGEGLERRSSEDGNRYYLNGDIITDEAGNPFVTQETYRYEQGVFFPLINLINVRESIDQTASYVLDKESKTVKPYRFVADATMNNSISHIVTKDCCLYGDRKDYRVLTIDGDAVVSFPVQGYRIVKVFENGSQKSVVTTDGTYLYFYQDGKLQQTIETQQSFEQKEGDIFRLGRGFRETSKDHYFYEFSYFAPAKTKFITPVERVTDDRVSAMENLDLRVIQPLEEFIETGLDLLRDYGNNIEGISETNLIRILQNYGYHDDGERFFNKTPQRLAETVPGLNIDPADYPGEPTLEVFLSSVLDFVYEHHPEYLIDHRVSVQSQEVCIYRILSELVRSGDREGIQNLMDRIRESGVKTRISKGLDQMWRYEAGHNLSGGNRFSGWKYALECLSEEGKSY